MKTPKNVRLSFPALKRPGGPQPAAFQATVPVDWAKVNAFMVYERARKLREHWRHPVVGGPRARFYFERFDQQCAKFERMYPDFREAYDEREKGFRA